MSIDKILTDVAELNEEYRNPLLSEGFGALYNLGTTNVSDDTTCDRSQYNIFSNLENHSLVFSIKDIIYAIDEMVASATIQYYTSEKIISEVLLHYPHLNFPQELNSFILSNKAHDDYNEFNLKVYESVYHSIAGVIAERLILLGITDKIKSFNFIYDRYSAPCYIVIYR